MDFVGDVGARQGFAPEFLEIAALNLTVSDPNSFVVKRFHPQIAFSPPVSSGKLRA
jgi:hypothetical protein